jgi:hypothetical protein
MIPIMRPIPQEGNPWGIFVCIKGTPWGDLIPVIDGGVFSHALHGNPYPFLNQLGPPPAALPKMLPPDYRLCIRAREETCLIAAPQCVPGAKLPDCYEAPNLEEDASLIASIVALAWRDKSYVVVVDGVEFVI